MSRAADDPRKPESDRAPPERAGGAGSVHDLSNDYLNHYSEPLMLMELAADDPGIAAELAAWEPLGYEAYFQASPLRRAQAALAAYEALPPDRRAAFEDLVRTMDTLTRLAVIALQPPCRPDDAGDIAAMTAPALRGLVERAAAFLNSGGADLQAEGEVEAAQSAIDRIMTRTGE